MFNLLRMRFNLLCDHIYKVAGLPGYCVMWNCCFGTRISPVQEVLAAGNGRIIIIIIILE
jgi:hypothetical protein